MLPSDILILIRQFRGERNPVWKQTLTSYIHPKVIRYFQHVNPVLLSDTLCYIRPDDRNTQLHKIVALGTSTFEYDQQQQIQTLHQPYWTLRDLVLTISEIEIHYRSRSEYYDLDRIFLTNAAIRYEYGNCILTPEWTY